MSKIKDSVERQMHKMLEESTEKISSHRLESLLRKNGGKFFSCVFTKKNKEDRFIHCRLGVVKGTKGKPNKVQKQSNALVTVWDRRKEQHRNIDLSTVSVLKLGGVTYEVL